MLLAIAAVLLTGGLVLVILSLLRTERIFSLALPGREVRRIWLPLGLTLITVSALFGVTYTTTLPSSPLRQAQTQDMITRHVQSTMGAHTVYFVAHTQTIYAGTASPFAHNGNRRTVSAAMSQGMSTWDVTSTVSAARLTLTQHGVNVRLIQGEQGIPLTGTYSAQATATATRWTRTPTPVGTPYYSPTPTAPATATRPPGITDFEATATAIIANATQTEAAAQTQTAAP